MNNLIFKDAGRAIGGGKLTHVFNNDGRIIGHIVSTLGMYMVHSDASNWGKFEVAHTMAEAKTHFEKVPRPFWLAE